MKRLTVKIITITLAACMIFAAFTQPMHAVAVIDDMVLTTIVTIGMVAGVSFLASQINRAQFGGFWETKLGEYIQEGNLWEVTAEKIQVVNNKLIVKAEEWAQVSDFWAWLLDELELEGNATSYPIDQTVSYNGLPLADGSTLIVPSSSVFGNSLQFQSAQQFISSLSTTPTYMSFGTTYIMANENTLRVELGTYGNESNCTNLYINDSLWGSSRASWPTAYSYTGNEFLVVDNTYNNNRLAFCRECINSLGDLGYVRQDLIGPNGGYMVVRGAWSTQLGYGATTIQEQLGISTTTSTAIEYPDAIDDALVINPIGGVIANGGFLDAVLAGTASVSSTVATDATAGDIANLDNIGNYQSPGLQTVFPFCIPFDIYNFINLLRSERQAPHFEWRFQVPNLVDYTFVIDLAAFNSVATVLRTMELLGFIVGLAMVTRRLIKW